MKILIVSYAYPPITSPGAMRMSHFAKDLANDGCNVTVLTSENGYSSMISEENHDFVKFTQQKNLLIIRVSDFLNKNKLGRGNVYLKKGFSLKKFFSGLIFPDRDITWYLPVLNRMRSVNTKFDVVIGSYPQVTNLLLAKHLAKYFSSKLVIDMRDLWVDDENFMKKGFFRKKLEEKIESNLFESADIITSVSRYNVQVIKEANSNAQVRLIYNGYDQDIFKKTVYATRKLNNSFIIAYAGSFYGGERNPIPLLEAIKYISKEHDILFYVYGNPEGFLIDAVERIGLNDKVEFKGIFPQKKLLDELNKADLLLTITRTQKISKGELTTKTFEYIALQKPLLCLTKKEYEISDLLDSVPFAKCVDVDDQVAISKALLNIMHNFRSKVWGDFNPALFSRKAASVELKKCLENLLSE